MLRGGGFRRVISTVRHTFIKIEGGFLWFGCECFSIFYKICVLCGTIPDNTRNLVVTRNDSA